MMRDPFLSNRRIWLHWCVHFIRMEANTRHEIGRHIFITSDYVHETNIFDMKRYTFDIILHFVYEFSENILISERMRVFGVRPIFVTFLLFNLCFLFLFYFSHSYRRLCCVCYCMLPLSLIRFIYIFFSFRSHSRSSSLPHQTSTSTSIDRRATI